MQTMGTRHLHEILSERMTISGGMQVRLITEIFVLVLSQYDCLEAEKRDQICQSVKLCTHHIAGVCFKILHHRNLIYSLTDPLHKITKMKIRQ